MSNPTPVNISLTLRPEEMGLSEVEIQNSNGDQPVPLFKRNRKARLRLGNTLSVIENPGDAPILRVADDKFTTVEEFNTLEKYVNNLDLNPKHSHEYTDITGSIAGLVGKVANDAGHMQMVTLCDDFAFNEEGQLVLATQPEPGPPGPQGPIGWTPMLGTILIDERVVLQLIDYIGGVGEKPTVHLGEYLSGAGIFTTDIEDAVDIRGPAGSDSEKGIEEAPTDGESYMRRNGMWEQIQYLTDPEIVEIVQEIANRN